MNVDLRHGDCVELMRQMPDCSVDSVVTDPPYELGFMGKAWDGAGIAYSVTMWAEALRVLKPGGHLLAFGGTRTYHRMACAIEDAGFEIRDSIHWSYSTGFPKSLNVKKAAKDKCCQCEVPWSYGNGHPVPEHDLRQVRRGDVSASVGAGEAGGEVLLAGVSELGVRANGSDGSEPEVGWAEQSGVEGRGDVQASEGELRRAEIRPVSSGVPADGTGGRVHHGAPARDGAVGGPDAGAVGGGEPSEPRPSGQSSGESGVVSEQRGPQAWGGWPVCRGCGKPILPEGLGTALKPAHEPIVVARKPLVGTVAGNVLAYGTGGLNIDGCRVGTEQTQINTYSNRGPFGESQVGNEYESKMASGRWPANVVFDRAAGEALDQQSGVSKDGVAVKRNGVTSNGVTGWGKAPVGTPDAGGYGGAGGASRFFTQADFGPDDWPFVYQAKPSRKERNAGLDGLPEGRKAQLAGANKDGPLDDVSERFRTKPAANVHPTVKPVALMRHLVRLVTPPGGVVLDPFAGSGTTLVAAVLEGFDAVGCEMTDEYLPIIEGRVAWAEEQARAAAEAEANPEQPTLL